ncbi:helix-turn-helix domain-containing protein [Paenibacillus thermoaerophilus]|uniref:Helix-turn-helix domain-containing protein n=1 Tax=Paenibacillus thermoaerophilus TaxID=1215385 RepID=A0ABW2V4U4_9BACL|nr:helix-turn-helix domain-containing protein [Paenibacillus thermoaerophilus]TMV18154.1 helix-turn-helix domain-containing protein [Paenibacillus thermoaerophilus]
MNALLVDDDYFVVTALEKKIDWKSLQIEAVYTANNVAQARDIIMNHPVHILISDIDMPQGSGLELLAWIREENYNIQAIFLTNYADFNYAQKAIELQSFEYFLKPIEFDKLMLIIHKAVARSKEQQHKEKAIREGYFWQKNQAKIREHFWRKLVNGSVSYPMKPADIAHAAAEQNLPYAMTDHFQPLFIHIYPYNGSLGQADKGLFDFALLNVLYELFQDPGFSIETILEYKPYNWLAILRWNGSPDSRTLGELCSAFIPKANQYLKADACCNIALSGRLETISHVIKQLLDMNEEIVKCRNQIFYAETYNRQPKADYVPPDLSRLEELLIQNQPGAFLNETSRYLKEHVKHQTLNVSVLSLFRLDIVQLVYAFLKTKGIQAHKLYAGRTNDQLLAHSLNSVEDLEEYLQYLVNTAMEYRNFAEHPKSVVEQIKQYVLTHCGEDLTRNHLAEIVYLNPDYLARLFKKETGVSLGTYIIQARIAAAKHLLGTTQMSVYEIAKKVGYSNYSYFSKLFKQEVGLSPNEYKRGCRV